MTDSPERIERAEDWTPIERAYAEAMHEDCGDPPAGHPVDDHSPWSGGDLDGTPTWAEFTAQLNRHGLKLTYRGDICGVCGKPYDQCDAREPLRTAVRHLLEAWPNLVNHPSMNPSEIVALRAALAADSREETTR